MLAMDNEAKGISILKSRTATSGKTNCKTQAVYGILENLESYPEDPNDRAASEEQRKRGIWWSAH
jgi:hypothetical protein